jgi:hypothetical protein
MTDKQVQTHAIAELTDAELDAVAGAGKSESQIFQVLSNAVSDVLKSLGQALQTAARAG